MNLYEILALLAFVGTLAFGVSVILKYTKTKKLNDEQRKKFKDLLKKINSPYNNPKTQIIDYDKLYHKILLGFGYEGTFGEILKKEPNEIGDIQKVWDLHKLRNKLVHEFDLLSESILKQKAKAYEKEVKFLLQ